MKGFLTFVFASALLISASIASAKGPQVRFASSADVIQGLGETNPNVPDVSRDPNFRVYKFEKDGVTYVQINTLDDEVLTAIGLTRSGSFTLPIGTLPSGAVVYSPEGHSGVQGAPSETASASCPCSAVVVYQDTYATIVVVYGSGGEVIQVVVIHHVETPPLT